MNRQGQIPRSRGGICGVLLILLGLWGGLAPFVGPYFHFGFTPDKTWHYDSGRLYYSVIPGAAALLGGLLVAVTRNRGVGDRWWPARRARRRLVHRRRWHCHVRAEEGDQRWAARYSRLPQARSRSICGPTSRRSRCSAGSGSLILIVGAHRHGQVLDGGGQGRRRGRRRPLLRGLPAAARTASQPDLSQYPTVAGQFPRATTGQFPTPAGQFPSSGDFAPSQFPDTTTAPFPPDATGAV